MKGKSEYKKIILYILLTFLLITSITIYNSNYHIKIPESKIKQKKNPKVFTEKKKEIFLNTSKTKYIYIYMKNNFGYTKNFDLFKLYFENKYKNVIIIKKNYIKKSINYFFDLFFKIFGSIICIFLFFIDFLKESLSLSNRIISFIKKKKLLIFFLVLNFFYLFCFGFENFEPFEIEFKNKIVFSKINKGYFPDVKIIEEILLNFKK